MNKSFAADECAAELMYFCRPIRSYYTSSLDKKNNRIFPLAFKLLQKISSEPEESEYCSYLEIQAILAAHHSQVKDLDVD